MLKNLNLKLKKAASGCVGHSKKGHFWRLFHTTRIIRYIQSPTGQRIKKTALTVSIALGLTAIVGAAVSGTVSWFLQLPYPVWSPWGWFVLGGHGLWATVAVASVTVAWFFIGLIFLARSGFYRWLGQLLLAGLVLCLAAVAFGSVLCCLLLRTPIDVWFLIHCLQMPVLPSHVKFIALLSFLFSTGALALAVTALHFTPLQHAKKNLGSAHFANILEIWRAGLFAERGVLLGKAHGAVLRLPTHESVLVNAPTGGRKSTSLAVPNLLDWLWSAVINDFKGELFRFTAKYRQEQLGQLIYWFAPSHPNKMTHCYNPFYYVSRCPDLMLRDLQLIAEILIPAERVDGGFWYTSARDLFILLAIYLIETKDEEATLADLHDISKQEDFITWLNFEVQRKAINNPVFYQNAHSLLNSDAEKTQKNILKDFHSRMTLFADPLVRHATSKNDFDLRKLRQEKMSIYLQIPDSDKERLKPLLTLFWAQLVHLMTQAEPDLKKEPYPVLALLDEFGNMARINKLKEGMSFLRSYRVCSVVIVQYLSQIISAYGQHDAKGFLNAKIKIAFAMSDLDDAKFFSEALGKTTVRVHSSTSTSGKQESSSKNITYQTRPLLAPDELMRLKKDEAIIVVEAANPIRAKKYDVYKDKRYKNILKNLAEPQEQQIKQRLVNYFKDWKFILWLTFSIKKISHKKRLMQARKVLLLMNTVEFRESAAKFFCYVRKLDPFVFEELLLLSFKNKGFKVKHNKAYTGDGGIDGSVILPNKTRWAIQAKRYESHINPAHIQDFEKAVIHLKFDGGFFIHTGKTGAESYKNLKQNIVLISGSKLHQLITGSLN